MQMQLSPMVYPATTCAVLVAVEALDMRGSAEAVVTDVR